VLYALNFKVSKNRKKQKKKGKLLFFQCFFPAAWNEKVKKKGKVIPVLN
jgi:hypothetical protein